jgi:hypothetical protein
MQRRLVSAASQRGMGALVVVMVLFFIMSLVAAYASRNLIFEQKTSANNYRATQAFEAADAGLEWAIAMLNGGRIDTTCTPPDPVDTAPSSFRDRYLNIDEDGIHVTGLTAACVRGDAGWSCSCPTAGPPVLIAPSGTGATPTFSVRFFAMSPPARPAVVRVTVTGCSNFSSACYAGATTAAEARAEVGAVLGLAPSLTQVPAAALTVRRDLLDAQNARISSPVGVVINSGGAASAPLSNLSGPAGSPPRVVVGDTSLSPLPTAGGMTQGEMMFLANFGMAPASYRTLPAVVRFSCGAECGTQLQAVADLHPGRVIWIDGPLNIDSPATLGSVAVPAILVIDGDVSIGSAGNLTINGLVYSRGALWSNGAGTALVRGAFVAEGVSDPDPAVDGDFTITGAPRIVFDVDIVGRLKLAQARQVPDFGSIARVPGSWRNF